jgi:hypothetical protein
MREWVVVERHRLLPAPIDPFLFPADHFLSTIVLTYPVAAPEARA